MLPTLETARLVLAPVEAPDAGWLHDLLTTPEVRLYLCDDRVLGRDEVEGLVERARDLNPLGFGLWAVRLQGGGPMGCVALQPVSEAAAEAWPAFRDDVEPTIALHPSAWGRGYAREALEAALAYGFADRGLARIVALADEPNRASRRLLERCGFTPVGTGAGPRFPLAVYSLERPGRRGPGAPDPTPGG